ncbi:MAG: hypothetical protein ACJA01_001625 [Saprospiraceae bacterium]|jgi:hypothetical protein
MTKFLYFSMISLLIITTLISCDSETEESNVNLNIQLQYDGTPVFSGMEVDYALAYPVFFSKYSFYLSDIALTSSDGDYLLSAVEFVDLLAGKSDAASAEAGTSLSYTKVPITDYSGLKFNIGVSSTVNATAPNIYEAGTPLANTGEYWEGWSSYIFHKIEGRIDPTGSGTFETALALHIGSDAAFRSVEVNTPISINLENETIHMILDLAEALKTETGMFDLLETPQVHHLGVLPKVLPILDATKNAITIQ